MRDKRGGARSGETEWRLEDCMTVSSKEEGVWTYTSDGREETCGLYLVTIPDMVVELEILDMNVDCDTGLVVVSAHRKVVFNADSFSSQMFDGWELNGNVFPGPEDHHMSLEERSRALCSASAVTTKFISSQNAALVSFNIPTPGQGFKIRVKYHPNTDSKK